MNEPKRVLESGSPRLRALVLAGKRDAHGARTEKAVIGALGLAAGSSAAVGAGASSAWRAFVSHAFGVVARGASSKIGVGVIVAAIAGGTGYAAGRSDAPKNEAPTNARVVTPTQNIAATSAPTDERTAIVTPNETAAPPVKNGQIVNANVASTPPDEAPKVITHTTPPVSPSPLPTQALAPRSASSLPIASGAPSAIGPDIAAELASIRRARAFVVAGDGRAALRELDAYESQSPRGTFQEEGIALRVRALRLAGDQAGAAAALANLQSRFPASVQLDALKK